MSLTQGITATFMSSDFDPDRKSTPGVDCSLFQGKETFVPKGERGSFVHRLTTRHSGVRRVQTRFERVGDLQLPVIFVAGGISATRHVATSRQFDEPGWWDAQIGSELGQPIDLRRFQVLSADWLAPRSVSTRDEGDAAIETTLDSLDVIIDPADQAGAIRALLDYLDIGRIHTFIGSSYGAMVGLQFAATFPTRVEQLVAISGVHRAHPYSSAWRSLQREAVRLGSQESAGSAGLELARKLAMLTYRSPEEFDERFERPLVRNGQVQVGASAYLDHCGQKYAEITAPETFLRLSESIDLQNVDPAEIEVPVTVVGVEQDRLVPIRDSRELAMELAGPSQFFAIGSLYGHDAFLKEPVAIARILRGVLA